MAVVLRGSPRRWRRSLAGDSPKLLMDVVEEPAEGLAIAGSHPAAAA